jgi:hypothetical protein
MSQVRTFKPACEYTGRRLSYHKLLQIRALPLVFVEGISTRECQPADTGVHNPQVNVFHMPQKGFFFELLIATIPAAHDARHVCARNSMNLTQVRRDTVAMNQVIAR